MSWCEIIAAVLVVNVIAGSIGRYLDIRRERIEQERRLEWWYQKYRSNP